MLTDTPPSVGASAYGGVHDCVIVGGGPAGLAAAIYLARFHLDVLVVDAGNSRAAAIPLTRNHAGFPDGIAGPALLDRMREQAVKYGAQLVPGEATGLAADGGTFTLATSAGTFAARAVLLATGVVNRRPDMPQDVHDRALQSGLLRYCPICDGYEVTDKKIGVIGTGERGAKEALFLRSYSADITLIDDGASEVPPALRSKIDAAGVVIVGGPVGAITLQDHTITVKTGAGALSFDTLYPALGSDIRSELAVALGAEATDDGCMTVDAHQRTSVPGIYAAGDVVLGLDQISHAMGEGGVAATTIRNDLAEQSPLYRAQSKASTTSPQN